MSTTTEAGTVTEGMVVVNSMRMNAAHRERYDCSHGFAHLCATPVSLLAAPSDDVMRLLDGSDGVHRRRAAAADDVAPSDGCGEKPRARPPRPPRRRRVSARSG